MSDTQTAEPTTLPQDAATASEGTATDEAAVTPSEAAAALDGTEQAAEAKSPPSWAKDDPYEALEDPALKEIIDRDWARKEADLVQRMEQAQETQHQRDLASRVNDQLQSLYGRIDERLAVGDVEGAERFLGRLAELKAEHGPAYESKIRDEQAGATAAGLLQHLKAGMDRRTLDEFETKLRYREFPDWPDVLKFREKAVVDRAVAPFRERAEKAEAEVERLKVLSRDGKGPPLGEGSGGGGKRYSQMTREERNALSPAERDALIAREMGA